MNGTRQTFALAAVVLGASAALTGASSDGSFAQLAHDIDTGRDHISAVEAAEFVMHGKSGLQIFDLRSSAEFEEFHLPGAVNTTVADLMKETLAHNMTIVLYSAGGAHAAQAWTLLRLKGYRDVFFLREGVYEWTATVLEPQLPVDPTSAELTTFERAKVLSRFFGGSVTTGVPRSELRQGYWIGSPNDGGATALLAGSSPSVTSRRRGC